MKIKSFQILKEHPDHLTVVINGKERRLRRRVREKYIPPSRRGKWWKVTGEGKGHSREIKITCNGIPYKSLSECARQIGISKSKVSKILAGQKSELRIFKSVNKQILNKKSYEKTEKGVLLMFKGSYRTFP